MTYTFVDKYHTHFKTLYPAKVWAITQKLFDRHISDIVMKFIILSDSPIPNIAIPELDHIRILDDRIEFHFANNVSTQKDINSGRFILEGDTHFNFHGNIITSFFPDSGEAT